MDNKQIARVLRETAQLLEIDGAIIGRYRSYEKAAELIDGLPESIEQLAKEPETLKELPGIGDRMVEHLQEIVKTGDLRLTRRGRRARLSGEGKGQNGNSGVIMLKQRLAFALVRFVCSLRRSRTYTVGVSATSLILTGCSAFTVVTPPNGATSIASPVSAKVTWNDSGMNSIHFTVDGVDQTSAFAITNLSNGGSATASLALSPGNHTLVAMGDYYFLGTIHTSDSSNFTVIGPFFTLNPSPNPLTLAPGGSGPLTVGVTRGGGFSGPVMVAFSGFPAGVSANPSPLNILATSASGQSMLTATSATATGQFTISVNGSSGTLTNQQSFTLKIAWPTPNITSVSPNLQAKGGTITVTGTNFSTTCANNAGSLGGVSNIAPTAPCTATSLKFQVPQQASFGHTTLSVTSNGNSSNSVSFTVARTPGLFTEITSNIEGQLSSQTCSTGAVQLNICKGTNCAAPNSPYTATYNRGTTQIGQPLGFHNTNTRVANLGGAGFSLCTVGAVLDADTTSISPQLMGIQFLDLTNKNLFPPGGIYTFNFDTPGRNSYLPRIFQSPDGTIFIVVTASTLGPSELTAAVIDQVTRGNPDQSCQSQNVTNNFSASITASNQISASLAGTPCTINIH